MATHADALPWIRLEEMTTHVDALPWVIFNIGFVSLFGIRDSLKHVLSRSIQRHPLRALEFVSA
jgi:hypothetical protein